MSQYSKFVWALAAAILTAAAPAVVAANGHYSQVTLVNVVIAGLGAASVLVGPNTSAPGFLGGGWTKLILAALAALAEAVATYLGSGGIQAITVGEWVQIGVAVLGAASVGWVSNGPAAPARAA